MSSIVLPKSTLQSLDKISRNFIWNSSPEARKQHLVSWKRVCLPKSEGGLGIRAADPMNKALIAKVGWRMLHDVSSLWARVLRSKYKVGTENWIMPKTTWSSTWRSIASGLREVVIPNLSWVVGNGTTIRFWRDRWLDNTPLIDFLVGNHPVEVDNIRIRDLWVDGGGWRVDQFEQLLPSFVVLRIRAVMVDSVSEVRDRVMWGGNNDGCFSVKSAYDMLCRNESPRPNMAALFGQIWKIEVPERARVYLWLVVSQVIMTNMERHRRHLSDSGICQVCKSGEETIIHILRDCPAISGVWSRLVPQRKRDMFFSQTLLEWVYANMREDADVEGIPWPTLFGMVVWWSWKWRCRNVFGTDQRCRDRVRFVKEMARDVSQAYMLTQSGTSGAGRVTHQIAWAPPEREWVRLNTDGASRGNPGMATAGGVLRDSEGKWLGGFALNIGICSAPLAELWGVYYGLCLAWDRKILKLELVVDSQLVVGFLRKGISETHPLSTLVHMCYDFLSKDWTVHISHGYREANRLADGFANYAFSQPLGVTLFDSCPSVVLSLFVDDSRGVSLPRRIRL